MAKKAATKKSPAKKAASKSATAKKATTKKAPAKKAAAKKKAAPKKAVKKGAVAKKIPSIAKPVMSSAVQPNGSSAAKPKKLPAAFLKKQQQKLLDLRDNLVDQMNGVARDTLRGAGEDGSAFGMHQADAGSDAYDRDFALNLLSQEQDALYEIEEAIQRVDNGTYGICEMSGKPIPEARLEAIPFARLTVDCQEKLEQELGRNGGRNYGRPARSLFGLMDSTSSASSGESLDND